MGKVAILVEDQYQVLEVWYPYLRLREDAFKAVLVGTGTKKEYKSKEGYPAAEELSIKKAKIEDFDGVIIPGGYAPDILRRHEDINSFVAQAYRSGKMVASVCHGGWVLVSAGIRTFCKEIIKRLKGGGIKCLAENVGRRSLKNNRGR